uniref:ATP synthase peripheral stalk subunit F6, mitochondrial n=1 Tax=Monodelphis domestica TaxID=13616 RepID=A0A5F8G2Y4_MONDO
DRSGRVFRRSELQLSLRTHMNVTAITFSKELDPIHKLFLIRLENKNPNDKKLENLIDIGCEYQPNSERELFKLKQIGKADQHSHLKMKWPTIPVSLPKKTKQTQMGS